MRFRKPLPKIDDYSAFLQGWWHKAVESRTEGAPTVVSTFAGAGGSSLGYAMAGFRELLAVEWDPAACKTFRLNFPHVPVFQGDVRGLSATEVLELVGLEPGELDVLDGSPPCQGFSIAGKRRVLDPRNSLFEEFVRLLHGLGPKALVMENVGGLVRGKMRPLFRRMTRELGEAGYRVTCRLVDAQWLGVPQARQRLIWIGFREDLDVEPSHPVPLWQPVTAREALAGVEPKKFRTIKGKTLKAWRSTRPGTSMPNFQARKRLSPDKPCNTQAARPHFHWGERREISIEEMARLQSFPDEFVFHGSSAQKMQQIGNSVPPLMMRAIAAVTRETLAHTA
jgi:DNA (cytosine-5)-methyltransferase 1